MAAVLLKAMSFLLIIGIGYTLKRVGMFSPLDYRIVMKIVMNLTLPGVIISSFADFSLDISLLAVIGLGFLANIGLAILGYFMARKKDGDYKAFNLLNYSGFNIGCFTIPFVQNFMGSFGVIVTSMFDAGNAIMSTGGTYAIASRFAGKGEKQSVGGFLRKLLSSVPFDTYMLMLIFAFVGIKLPAFIYDITDTFGSANTFLSMLMIGLVFEIDFDRTKIKRVLTNLAARHAFTTVLALTCYFILPFSMEIRHALVIVALSPTPSMSPVFTEKLGGDASLSGVISSCSICISLIIITILTMCWQV